MVSDSRGKKSARISMRKQRNKCTTTGSGTDTDPISSLINKKRKRSSGNKQTTSRKTKTRTRSKTRKPKYLSLRLQFSREKSQEYYSEMPSSTVTTTTTTTTTTTSNSNQLNLFPLHPENLVEEKEAHDENMAYLFSAADGGATTLTGLLGSSTKPSFHQQVDDKNNNSDSSTTTLLSPSASLTYAYAGRQEEEDSRDQEVALVRTALRNKEREPSEERWVRYSEVVERRDDQEVSSCAVPDPRRGNQGLSLKLDYEEILTAWSDKGPLFLHAACAASSPQSPQTVPDIHHDFLFASQLPNRMIKDGWANNDGGGVWRVPEFTKSQGNEQGPDSVKVKIEEQQEEQGAAAARAVVVVGGGDQWKVGQREASVKRYKEKRLNRLFSKRIRYQVRKLNAEKRPRIKGRFVKRS